jgi:hypothetical protein
VLAGILVSIARCSSSGRQQKAGDHHQATALRNDIMETSTSARSPPCTPIWGRRPTTRTVPSTTGGSPIALAMEIIRKLENGVAAVTAQVRPGTPNWISDRRHGA